MKTKYIKTPAIILMAITLGLFSCKKDDDDKKVVVDPPKETTSELEMHFHQMVGGSHFKLNQSYSMNVSGVTIDYTVTNSAFYISGIKLNKLGGGNQELSDTYLLVKPEEEHYHAGEIEAVHYTGLSFDIGIDSATNHLDPSTYETGSPLAPQNPPMHWSWNPGYRFFVMEGTYTSSDGDNGTFTFHIGLDEYLSTINITLNEHLMAEAGKPAVVHMSFDYAEVLAGIDLRTEHFTKAMSPSDKPLATKIVNNLQNAFKVD